MDALLASDEEPAVEIREGGGSLVIVCEHASNRLPQALGSLGLKPSDLDRHIAWDPGAAGVAAAMAAALDATLVMQRYSRLAIDCNRHPELPDAVATFSEDTSIPGNIDLSPAARAGRIATLWEPFHAALDRIIDGRLAAGQPTKLVTVHSFTPVYRGVARPWHVGIISTEERSLADVLLAALSRDRSLTVGDNEPYSAKDNVDYTIRRHGLDRGVPHAMIEIRNDIVRHAAGQREWAARLAGIFRSLEISGAAA
jgi:predicted N-formylglutamate amidohydrolase